MGQRSLVLKNAFKTESKQSLALAGYFEPSLKASPINRRLRKVQRQLTWQTSFKLSQKIRIARNIMMYIKTVCSAVWWILWESMPRYTTGLGSWITTTSGGNFSNSTLLPAASYRSLMQNGRSYGTYPDTRESSFL